MSKAEKFIQDCTRNCSNELVAVESRASKEVISYHEWLTPEQARKAVEIERNEILLNVAEWIKDTFIFSKDAKKDFSQTFNIKLL
jgi:hypothetical protein